MSARTWKQWEKELYKIYDEYERKYFRGRMPKRVMVVFGIGCAESRDGTRLLGYVASYNSLWGRNVQKNAEYKITIDWETRHIMDQVRITLLHEMVHIVVNDNNKCYGHGPKFKREIRRLMRAGAYDGLL